MKVFVLGLDGATWDILEPLVKRGELPNLQRLMEKGASGTLGSVFPPLSPVAWTTVMTGKNSGKHGVFEFLEYAHNPLKGRVNSSRAIKTDLVWEIAGRHGKKSVAGGVPMSYPHRQAPGFYLGDFLSPADAPDFASDPAIFAELEKEVGTYRPWASTVHDGGNEAQVLKELTDFLDQHLKAVQFLMGRCEWDLFMFDLMATDRIQHELWHVWDQAHRLAKGRDFSALQAGCDAFWKKLDQGIGAIEQKLPADSALILMSDHGFGGIEWYVNFNVWLLERGDLALQDSLYVKQKHWFYKRGATPEWFYGLMAKFGLAGQRVSRFRGKQTGLLDRLAESAFLSRRHIDWSKTRAYSQGNFGQIFLNLKGRQPQGCVEPEDARGLLDEIKAGLLAIPHPETGEPLVDRVCERDDLYAGPHAHLAPDLTVVLRDWRYRTIGLHDFTTNKLIAPAFGPTGDHRMEGMIVASGPAFRAGATPQGAALLDIAPTVLHLLGVPVPDDMDGRVLTEILDSAFAPTDGAASGAAGAPSVTPAAVAYTEEEDAEIQQRLADLGYL
ncbi:Predicted phosphohydrolase or phosphomutase, AlkP superfamily [Singulisphaera sp. GP187]|uniref:alkaline phosphatase family protein n=1 Tax=Singulisphaera sp. GP187 TaxID=1882752 RepID=UPI000925B4AB|nr:alkaline phosphatase family protein [Singulisphaera sp. GP187]SIO42002.1 Predicted phosphohydrolase or phosphomutase, AlkP superfamily [Singulisphaera sp. GP187]